MNIDDMDVIQLRTLVTMLANDADYGCLTRQGLELITWPEIQQTARWIIFADIDHLHDANEEHGYEGANQRIRQAIQLRKTDVAAAGRWFSGDELVWVLCVTEERTPINPILAARRLQDSFEQVGLTATFGISQVCSPDLVENVSRAAEMVTAAKGLGQRNTICIEMALA